MSLRASASLLIGLCLAAGAAAAPSAEKSDLDFGRWLMDRQEYYRAVSEFQRFSFFNPSSALVAEADWLSGLSLFRAGRWSEAVTALGRISTNEAFGYRASVYRADAWFQNGSFERSRDEYRRLIVRFPSKRIELVGRMIWPAMMDRRFDEAVELCDEVLESSPDTAVIEEVETIRSEALKLGRFKPLSPVLAGILSGVLPGTGQIYAKRAGDGLIAFGSVAGLSVASWLLWTWDPHKELAVALSLGDLFLYSGNIYSAVTSVKKYNVLYYRKNLDGLKETRWKELILPPGR